MVHFDLLQNMRVKDIDELWAMKSEDAANNMFKYNLFSSVSINKEMTGKEEGMKY